MPRSPEANEQVRQATKEKILIAAKNVFFAKGFHSASIDDVAKAALISKGLLYNYFKGKEDLLAALVDVRIDELMVVMNEAKAKQNPLEQLRHIIVGALEDVQKRPEAFRFYQNLFTQPKKDEIIAKQSARLNQEYEKQFKVQTEIFRKLGVPDPVQRSLYFSSAIQGVMLLFSTYPEFYPLEKVKEQLITEFCRKN